MTLIVGNLIYKPLATYLIITNEGDQLPPRFDPLGNISTSRTLFLLILEVDTPKQLADSLGIKPPSVIAQLRRLRKLRLVKASKRIGKEQHYDVDWERLTDLSIHRALKLPQPDLKEQDMADETAMIFSRSEKFREFVRRYLVSRLQKTPRELLLSENRTFVDLLDDLNLTIVNMVSKEEFQEKLRKGYGNDQPLKEVFNDLVLWKDHARHVSEISRSALTEALREIGFETSAR
jgi:hypothetical protein